MSHAGTRQAYLPGGHRTGAPGKHVVRGKAKYRLLDDRVRVFVAPPIEEIEASAVSPVSFFSLSLLNVSIQLKPYVAKGSFLSPTERDAAIGRFPAAGGLTPKFFLDAMRSRIQTPTPSASA
jgi:large subunit ribosomal protein L41